MKAGSLRLDSRMWLRETSGVGVFTISQGVWRAWWSLLHRATDSRKGKQVKNRFEHVVWSIERSHPWGHQVFAVVLPFHIISTLDYPTTERPLRNRACWRYLVDGVPEAYRCVFVPSWLWSICAMKAGPGTRDFSNKFGTSHGPPQLTSGG